jgi:hypothetical protein
MCDDQPAVLGPLADGDYVFEVQATDERGSTDPTPDSHAFSIQAFGPDVQILSGPPPLQEGSTATFDFSSTQAVGYRCALAPVGGVIRWTSCSAPEITYDGLDDGLYLFQVRSLNAAGDLSRPGADWLFLIDNDGPSLVLFTTPPRASSAPNALFEFRGVGPVAAMTCAVDVGVAVDCSSGSFTATELTEGAHILHIVATDQLGLTSDTTFDWKVDMTPPTLTVEGRPPDFTSVNEAEFAFAQDEASLTFHCTLDGAPAIVCPPQTVYYVLPEGLHMLMVSAFDSAGNETPGIPLTWTQDTIAPTVTITSGPAQQSPIAEATLQFVGSEDGLTYACSLDGESATTCTSPMTYDSLAEGTHGFDVTATDAAGNVGLSAEWDWAVDLTAPVTTISSGPADPTFETSASFEFTSDDPSAVLTCSLDGGSATTCTSPMTYDSLTEGTHTFDVTAIDGAGNVGPAVEWIWTILSLPRWPL